MVRQGLPESLKDSKLSFHGAIFDVHSVLRPTRQGLTKEKYVVVHPGAAVILPLLPQDVVIMIRNYRFAIDKQLWELPAGTLEASEAPQWTAARELKEETGYEAKRITPLLNFYSSPGFCNEQLHAFLAEDLHFVGQKLDETEQIVVEHVPLKQALDMIDKGVICDAKSIVTLLHFYKSYRS